MRTIRTPMLRKTAAAKLPAAKAVRHGKRLGARIDQTARDEESLRARGYKPTAAEEVDDLALLPRRFDHFASEVRQSFEILANQILPKLDSIAAKQLEQGEDIHALKRDVTELRRDNVELKRDRAEVASRLAAVEKQVFKRPRSRRKK